MLFEDHPMADFDMNDVVLKVQRVDATHIKVSVVACGAYDELYLRGLKGKTLNEDTEIHSLFGANINQFVNTKPGQPVFEPIEEVFTVSASETMETLLNSIYIYDKTIDRNINLAGKGEAPHSIVVPGDFAYPTEGTCIKNAYPKFVNWVHSADADPDWYLYPKEGKTYQ